VQHLVLGAGEVRRAVAGCRRGHLTQPSTNVSLIWVRQELERLEPDQTVAVRDGTLTLQVAPPLPSVSLLEIRPATR